MTNCRICGNSLELVLDLGFHPPSDRFLTKEQLQEPETYYPLELYNCSRCGLVQIGYVVSRETLFQNDYPYTTGINEKGIEHFNDMAQDVIDTFKITETDFIVDIGGNDGTLLKPFQDKGCDVLNIDPSGVESKVHVEKRFWDVPTAYYVLHKHGKAEVVLATNVFAHVDDVHEFVKAIKVILDDGVFIIESPCLDDMLEFTQFDQIYHEHLSYFNEKPIKHLMAMHDMTLIATEHNDFHGGSNRYFIRKIH